MAPAHRNHSSRPAKDGRRDARQFTRGRNIASISTFTPPRAGDVIITGTPGGVGLLRNPVVAEA